MRETSGSQTRIGGLDAHLGTYEGEISGLGRVTVRAAHIQVGRSVYFVAGYAKTALYRRCSRTSNQSLQSFRELSRDEADNIKPEPRGPLTRREAGEHVAVDRPAPEAAATSRPRRSPS